MSELRRELSRAYVTIALLDLTVAYLGWQGGHAWIAILMSPLALVAAWVAFLNWTKQSPLGEHSSNPREDG